MSEFTACRHACLLGAQGGRERERQAGKWTATGSGCGASDGSGMSSVYFFLHAMRGLKNTVLVIKKTGVCLKYSTHRSAKMPRARGQGRVMSDRRQLSRYETPRADPICNSDRWGLCTGDDASLPFSLLRSFPPDRGLIDSFAWIASRLPSNTFLSLIRAVVIVRVVSPSRRERAGASFGSCLHCLHQ